VGRASLFSEKSFQSSFGLFDPVGTSPPAFGSSQNKVIAEVGPLFIYDPLSQDLAARVVGVRVIELALLTASKIAMAMRTGVFSPYGADNIQTASAKSAAHDVSVFNQRITPSPWIARLPYISCPQNAEADARTNPSGQLFYSEPDLAKYTPS
jgi:hypothetical protein